MKPKSVVNKTMTVNSAHGMMQLLNMLSKQTTGNPTTYGKPIAKTLMSIDREISRVTNEVRERHVQNSSDDDYFQLAAQLDTVNKEQLTQGQLKQVDDMHEKKDKMLEEDSTLQERYEKYIDDMEKSANEEVEIDVWQISEQALPKDLSPQTMTDLYKYELLKENG